MHARLSRYEVDPERMDEAVRGFENAAPGLAQIEGNNGGFLLVDRASGELISVTLWQNEAMLENSEARAASLRRQAMSPAEGAITSVGSYEIAVEFER